SASARSPRIFQELHQILRLPQDGFRPNGSFRKLGMPVFGLGKICGNAPAYHSHPNFVACRLEARTVWCGPRHGGIYASKDILDKDLLRILRMDTLPPILSEYPHNRAGEAEECS